MKRMLAAVVGVTCLTLHAAAQNSAPDAGAVINAVTAAMGTGKLRSVQYTGTGSTNPTGQAYTTGGPWPRFTVTKYAMSIDYSLPAMRQELVRIDDARPPRGGGAGGYNPTTFQGGIRPIPGDVIQNQTIDARTGQNGAIAFWLTPHGFVKGVTANMATAKTATVRGKKTLTFTAFGKFPITATLDDRNVIEKVEALVDIPYTGDTVLDGTYTEYRDLDGIRFPMHLVMRENGFPTLEVAVAQVRPNTSEAVDTVARATSAQPAAPSAAAPRQEPQPQKLAEGVWQLTPNGEGSILVEFKDYLVMVEAPGSDAVTAASIASARRLAPNKPIKYVVNTHHHADHAGGMRAYVAEGIPIITHESHRKYYEEQIFKNPHSINPDRLAREPRAPMIETVKDKRVLTDGTMSLEIHLMRDQPHSEGLLMVYLPKDKLLIQSDAYIPRPGAPPLPAPSPYTTNLVDNITRLKLDVARVVHVHGGSSPYSDVLEAAGRPRSTN
jgi:glyoxylase-like metal-dependent hydrolase (beta-lactamase superfamily II)